MNQVLCESTYSSVSLFGNIIMMTIKKAELQVRQTSSFGNSRVSINILKLIVLAFNAMFSFAFDKLNNVF